MDFEKLKKDLQDFNRKSSAVIDEVMYYGAAKNKLDPYFEKFAKRHKNVVKQIEKSNWARFKSQYIVHEIFKDGGLMSSYWNHAYIRSLPPESVGILKKISQNPWKYTFWKVLLSPFPDFYSCLDMITSEEFLLYSPSLGEMLDQGGGEVFTGLLDAGETCRQSFGPMIGYLSIDMDDFYYFAGEIDFEITEHGDLDLIVRQHLFLFLLVTAFARIPRQILRGSEFVQVTNDLDMDNFDYDRFKEFFWIEYREPVFRMLDKEFGEFPHYATCYFHEEDQILTLLASTDEGYEKLLDRMDDLKIAVKEVIPVARLHLAMRTAIEEIFNLNAELDPYLGLFRSDESEELEDNEEMDKLNEFVQHLIPLLNVRQPIDIDQLIKHTGADSNAAKSIYLEMKKKLGL